MSLVVKIFGRAFQIYDDVVNLVGKNFGKMKNGLGADITEGKLSFPVVFCLAKYRARKRPVRNGVDAGSAGFGGHQEYRH